LGIEVICQNAKLRNRIEIRNNTRSAIHVLLNVTSVHQKAIGRFSLSTDRNVSCAEFPGRSDRAGDSRHDYGVWFKRSDRRDVWLIRQQISIAASVQGECGLLHIGDNFSELGSSCTVE